MTVPSRFMLLCGACLMALALLFSHLPGQASPARAAANMVRAGENLAMYVNRGYSGAQTATLTLRPDADAYVIQTAPNTNFGSNTTLSIDNSPVTRSYLRFVVSGLNGAAVQSAKLRVYTNSANPTGLSVYALANNRWTETGLTYNNAPAPGSRLASASSSTAGQWLELDVSRYVKAAGSYSLVLETTGATNTNVNAREAVINAPQLVIVLGAQSPAGTPPAPRRPPPDPPAAPPGASSSILLLAGDICKHNQGLADYTGNCKKTGDLIRSVLAENPGAQVQTLGDNVNNDPSGSYDSEYADLYAPAWGSFLNVTHALMGNHDTYAPSKVDPYYHYFGAQSGGPPGYYTYNIGANWHVIVLNAQCSQSRSSAAGGCTPTSAQTTWLKNDLETNTRKCVLAVWHQPRWTSGRHKDNKTYAPWWDLLYQYKADIVANGHNHNYERFDLIDPAENAASDGIREFVVGTGGAPTDNYTYDSHPLDPNEAIRSQSSVYGVLQLTLNDNSYDWKFLPVPGYSFTDSGSQACH